LTDTSSVPQWVTARAEANPSALAVVDGESRLTYGALLARSRALAHRLRDLGAARDQVVALVLPRSTELVVASLATMHAGAAYAPLDPSSPAERLAAMLADARPAAVVTTGALQRRLPRGTWTTVTLDADAPAPAGELPSASPAPADLAYVIYTSGSTGSPKGVEITHGGLLNLVRWHHEQFALTPADRAPLMASPGFDAAVWETWPYLTAGASLHVVDELIRVNPDALRDWLLAEAITVAFVATPLAERLLTLRWPRTAPLRALLTGADTLHHHPPAGLPFALVNNYGPTECTVVATSGLVPPDPLADALPSIGWPIANVRVHVLDERGRMVRPGDEGELYVGGASVARGYRNLPELTAERFVPDPFGPEGARLYRTGDRVRSRPDGALAFLGRVDDQVKVRGHRVELDEIVAVLDTHPGVVASAVAAGPGPDGETRLVAYVVAAGGARLTPAGLLATLRARLPGYMLPAVFVQLESLPLTASGKLDRARLPAADSVVTLRDAEIAAPRTEVEARLATLVAGLLEVAPIGVTDNFFLLGGHSLLGTQLIARIRDAFGVDLSLRAVFDHPTVAALADEIERAILAGLETAA
jgi:amino acid adenylation domain-containing protein